MKKKINVFHVGGRAGVHRSYSKFPLAMNYFLFEADKNEAARLSKEIKNKKFNNKYYISSKAIGLGKKGKFKTYSRYSQKKTKNLSRYKGENGSFFYINKKHWYRFNKALLTKEIILKKIGLFEFSNMNNIKSIEFISVDTEGLAFEVLKSLNNLILNVLGIRTEIEFNEIFKNAPLLMDTCSLLIKKGFIIVRIETCNTGFQGYTSDMNDISISPYDAVPTNADFIFINDKKIRNLIKLNADNYKLISALIFLVHNRCGYKVLDYLQLIKDFNIDFEKVLEKEKLTKIFLNTFVAYMSIKREGINSKVNIQKIFKKFFVNHNFNKILKNINKKYLKEIHSLYDYKTHFKKIQ